MVLKSRHNIINKRYKVTLVCLYPDVKLDQKVSSNVVLSVDFRDGAVHEVIVLKDNDKLFDLHKKDALAAVEKHLLQNVKIENITHTI